MPLSSFLWPSGEAANDGGFTAPTPLILPSASASHATSSYTLYRLSSHHAFPLFCFFFNLCVLLLHLILPSNHPLSFLEWKIISINLLVMRGEDVHKRLGMWPELSVCWEVMGVRRRYLLPVAPRLADS